MYSLPEQFLGGVAAVDHTLPWPAEFGLHLGNPLLRAIHIHLAVAARVVLPIEAEKFIWIGAGEAQILLGLRLPAGPIGEVIAAPLEPGRLSGGLLPRVSRIAVIHALRSLVDHANDTGALHLGVIIGRVPVREVDDTRIEFWHFRTPLPISGLQARCTRPGSAAPTPTNCSQRGAIGDIERVPIDDSLVARRERPSRPQCAARIVLGRARARAIDDECALDGPRAGDGE